MGDMNKIIVIGNVGRDPEMRYSTSGQPITSFSVAPTTGTRLPLANSTSKLSGLAAPQPGR
jgi:hypothetical protein